LEILRMMIGKRKPKMAEVTDGRTPETIENYDDIRNLTYEM